MNSHQLQLVVADWDTYTNHEVVE